MGDRVQKRHLEFTFNFFMVIYISHIVLFASYLSKTSYLSIKKLSKQRYYV